MWDQRVGWAEARSPTSPRPARCWASLRSAQPTVVWGLAYSWPVVSGMSGWMVLAQLGCSRPERM